MNLFQQNEINVRILTESDAPLLVRWLSDPQVLEYYEGRDRPADLESVIKHFYDRTHDITQCIVQFKEIDIGYIQFYPIDEEERLEYGYADLNQSIYGMDQFIGEVEYWNKGIGTDLVNSMIHYIVKEMGVSKIVMDPQAWNQRAIRCYEKCGFVKRKLLTMHEWHEGEMRDCWLMEYDKAHSQFL